ncbi:unnamed protein product [Caenorhabditis brenneri]
MTVEIIEILDKMFAKPLKRTPRISLPFLKFFYAWTSVVTMWYIIFGAWFIRGAGIAYGCLTISLSLVLSLAFFFDSDGRGWKNFATLCVVCAIPRLLFTPIYAVASIQTANVNETTIPDFYEAFHHMDIFGFKNRYNDISVIWFIHYYSLMLFLVSIQRVTCRKAVEEKKQKVYSETLKVEETKRTENEQAAGPMHI